MQMGYTNQINAVQGFNQLTQQIAQLGFNMEQCCCSIKTQMLQQELDAERRRNTEQYAEISNLKQTQNILASMGRWVGWAGSGTQGTVPAAG